MKSEGKRLRATIRVFLAVAMLVCIFATRLAWVNAATAPADLDLETDRYTVYFPLVLKTGTFLFPISYIVPKTDDLVTSALESLIRGVPDKAGMMMISLPEETQVLNVSIENGLCTVDFSGEIKTTNVGAGGEAALIDAIVCTLCQFLEIDSVRILVDGEPTETLAGHVDISEPLAIGPYTSIGFVTFDDAYQHWGGGAISILHAMDIVDGYEDNTFRPDKYLTRAEFLKMMVECIGAAEAPHEEVAFIDLSHHWAKPVVQRAMNAGIIDKAHYGTKFEPDEIISREEMAHILLKVADVYEEGNSELEITREEHVALFEDWEDIQTKYQQSVVECLRRGLIRGFPDNTFRPSQGLTRAEGCVALLRAIGVRGNRVLVATPKAGFQWDGRDLFALGAAAAFEATVNFRVDGKTGNIVPESYTNSTCGMDWGLYGLCIDHTLLDEHDDMVLKMYLLNMEDGSPWETIDIPLTR
jgi:hypothetical protein